MTEADRDSQGVPRPASRRWSNRLGLAASVTLLVAILAVVQMMAERHNVRVDLTPSRRLSLAEPTRRILGEIAGPLRIEAYYARGHREEVADLLARFADASPHIAYEIFDIDRYPERARAGGVRDPDRARITYGDTHTVVSTASEEYLAGGILRAVRGRERDIYLLTGDGERTTANPTAPGSLSILAAALRAENARVRPLDPAAHAAVPEDAAAVILAGPARDLSPGVIGALRAYLARGGAVLALVEPDPLPALQGFLGEIGVRLEDDIVVEGARVLGTEEVVVQVPYYRMHPVTAPMDQAAVMVGARSVDRSDEAGLRVQTVARTAESAWATPETDSARRGDARFREGRDRPGPVPVMVAATLEPIGGSRGGRLVVIGDVDFATDGYIDQGGNRDLVLNSISWLTDEEALIARRPRDVAEIARPLSPLVLTEPQADVLFVGAVVVQPALALLIGAVVVSRRRRRG